jgi:hypothetical protein
MDKYKIILIFIVFLFNDKYSAKKMYFKILFCYKYLNIFERLMDMNMLNFIYFLEGEKSKVKWRKNINNN